MIKAVKRIGAIHTSMIMKYSPTVTNTIPATMIMATLAICQLFVSSRCANSNLVGNSENPQAEHVNSFDRSSWVLS
jgi:hypothetical protein